MTRKHESVFILGVLLVACGPAPATLEPDASQLAAKAIANLKSVATVHVEGTFRSEQTQMDTGASNVISAEMAGDSELPDSTRSHVRTVVYGTHFEVDTITIDGRAYTKDAALEPRWHETSRAVIRNVVIDRILHRSVIQGVVDVDRPEVDGRTTRHVRYRADSADATEMLDLMSLTPPFPYSDPRISALQVTGDLWIRTDDAQIVRQLVKISYAVEKGVTEMSLDLRLSRHGEVIPRVTPPPLNSRL
jgi:hypothetical protein